MENSEFVTRFIVNMLKVRVDVWKGNEADAPRLEAFEKAHCFLPAIQAYLNASALRRSFRNLPKNMILEIKGLLGIHLILFRLDAGIITVGPFSTGEWNDEQASLLLAKLGVEYSKLVSYKLYYCNYRLLSESQAANTIQAALNTVFPNAAYTYRLTKDGYTAKSEIYSETSDDEIKNIVRRYNIENQLLRFVKEGNVEEALKAHDRLTGERSWTTQIIIDLSTAKSSASILRTLLRKAIESVGVHPAIVDSISREYGEKINFAAHETDLLKHLREMVTDFAKVAGKLALEGYSPIVRKAVDYLTLNLSGGVTLEKVAQYASVSPKYLCRMFKAETGMTISQYIAKRRCEKAALLLNHDDLSISDIAAHVGYLDSNYFVKVFKRQYGVAPTEYRKTSKNKI